MFWKFSYNEFIALLDLGWIWRYLSRCLNHGDDYTAVEVFTT